MGALVAAVPVGAVASLGCAGGPRAGGALVVGGFLLGAVRALASCLLVKLLVKLFLFLRCFGCL